MINWPTPRLLLEVKEKGDWMPVKIYVQFKSVRVLLNKLPKIARKYGGLNKVRIKNLVEQSEIAAAKLAIYKRNDSRREKR